MRGLFVPRAGIEPALTEARGILSPLRLPISPPRHRRCDFLDKLHESQVKTLIK